MRGTRWAAVVAVGALVASPIGPAGAQDWREDPVRIVALSNRADLVSGGDVLLEVVLPARAATTDFTVTVGERDVTPAFGARESGRILGLVDGLALGPNTVTVTLPDGSGATLEVTNHPLGGPIFAGAQVQPWICVTEEQDLGPPLDEKCTAPPQISYQYMPEGGDSFQPYDPANPPSDVATTETDSGQTVPFIIRVEKGSMDRGIYGIAALYDPANPVPWAQDQWDHKVVTSFGGGCSARHEQPGTGVSLNAAQLGRGFAQISQGLFALGSNCNEIVAAEALVMLRERLIEVYGDIRYVLSTGCSGGSMMQLTISNSYPGLLDGITPTCTYPDQWTTWNETIDCSLMQRYWLNEPTGVALWPAEQQKAYASGHLSNSTCVLWDATFDTVVADPGACSPNDQEWEYHPENNPEGTRCTLADYQIAVYGSRPEPEWGSVEQQIGRGFANRPLDNVGVRYGLRALQNGQITTEQFVDLNEKIGGYDIDFNHVPERMEANPTALDHHYRAGRVTQGHNLGRVAIVDGPAGIANQPALDNVEFHTSFRGYMLRDRLINSRGHDENHIIARDGAPSVTDLLDRWLSAVDADTAQGTREDKILRNRPEDATDHCYLGGQRVDDQAACAAAWPYYADPRIAAGGPFTDHIMKCQLKPHRRNSSDYSGLGGLGVVFTDAQWERLEAAFPDGVCDYSKPAVGEQPVVAWQTYLADDGSVIYGGQAMGPAPVSVPFGPAGGTTGDTTGDTSGDTTGDTSGDTTGDSTGETTGDTTGAVLPDSGEELPTTGGGGLAILGALVLLAVTTVRRRVRPARRASLF